MRVKMDEIRGGTKVRGGIIYRMERSRKKEKERRLKTEEV